MAVNVKFDLVGNPEPPTIILAKRNGDKLGQLDVNAESIELSDKFNDASEMSFTLNKYVDGKLTPLWDKVVDFKLIWCKEWDMWFEITVELDEATETVKTVFCTQLGQAELSQINLYDIHINEEGDPNWNTENKEYKSTILYDPENTDVSLLHRLLKDKAPHYSIEKVDDTIKNIQRTFSFDDTSIHDAFQEIAEEIGCLFVYNSNSDENGKIQRTISVYDLQQNCKDCGHRGEFTDKCPKCGGTNIDYNEDVFKDTLIFVTADELASNGIELVTDTDSVKNCFKLEAGDDLMTATVRNCNPNGTDYIWYFSDVIKEDMSDELVERLESYDELYRYYYNEHVLFDGYATHSRLLSDSGITIKKDELPSTGNVVRFVCNAENSIEARARYETDEHAIKFIDFSTISNFDEFGNIVYDLYITEDINNIVTNEYVSVYLSSSVSKYNDIISKYEKYDEDLQKIEVPIKGYSSLMNAYYNVIDLELYLKSGLMPTVEMSDTSAQEQVDLLTASALSPVAVTNDNIQSISLATANSAVLSMAKIIVKSTYKVEVKTSTLSADKVWEGSFIVTNYSDENDTAESQVVRVVVNNDAETFIKQKIDRALNKEETDDYSISGLFNMDYSAFCAELKEYALNPLKSFYDVCDSCLNILIDQGAGNKTENPDLYEKLYKPYYDKSSAISAEIKIREDEVAVIEGVWDKTDEKNPELITKGIQQYIEECRNKIQDALNFEKYLGGELWLEFCAYRREDTYSNENYISDGLNNAQLFEKALEFVETAENEIYKSAELQHSISTSLNNLMAIDKFKPLVDSFEVGNWIRVRVDDRIFKLRLLEYEINFDDFNSISVEFSDITKIKNGATDIQNILSKASSMATSYSSVQKQASQGAKGNSVLNNWVNNGLNATHTKIVDSYDENLMFGKNSFWCRQYDPITDTYNDEQIKIVNSTIAITDDNWNTTKTAIGKFYYTDPTTGDSKVAYGVNAETVVGKFILGENMSIQNESGSMMFDGGGLIIVSGTEGDSGRMTFDDNGLVVSHGNNTVTISPKTEEVMNITNGEEKVFNISENGELSINGNIIARSLKLENGVKIDSGVITDLATIATSGSYDDLIDKPTKLSNFDNDGVFITKNADNLTNYYKKTEVDNFLSSKVDTDDLSEVAISGSYVDLVDSPSFSSVATSGSYDDLFNKPNLSTVATTGSYNDLVDIEELKNWVLEQIQLATN